MSHPLGAKHGIMHSHRFAVLHHVAWYDDVIPQAAVHRCRSCFNQCCWCCRHFHCICFIQSAPAGEAGSNGQSPGGHAPAASGRRSCFMATKIILIEHPAHLASPQATVRNLCGPGCWRAMGTSDGARSCQGSSPVLMLTAAGSTMQRKCACISVGSWILAGEH